MIVKAKVSSDTSQVEAFQNTVLRHIIKMKHDLLIVIPKHYNKKKKDFTSLNLENQLKYINACFERDQTFRCELRGVVIGQFTVDEYEMYAVINNAINKRILNIIKERMFDHMDVLIH